MIIQSDMPAMQAYRVLNTVYTNTAKKMRNLSSGFRINVAANDAAGLAISEKMRAQIRGLSQASRNTQDGISLIQTAEGGMREISNIMQRQRELVIQALNDTNTDDDRAKIQMEIEQLNDEIEHIAYYTEFNKIKVLCGGGEYTEIIGGGNGGGSGGGDIIYEDGVAIGEPTLIDPFYKSDSLKGNFFSYFDIKVAGGDDRPLAYFDFLALPPDYVWGTSNFYFQFSVTEIDPSLTGMAVKFTAPEPNGREFGVSIDMLLSTEYNMIWEYIEGLGQVRYFAVVDSNGRHGLEFTILPGKRCTNPSAGSAFWEYVPTADRDEDYDGRWFVSIDNSANNTAADIIFGSYGGFTCDEGYLAIGFIRYETWQEGSELPGQPGTPGTPPETITRYNPKQLWIQSGANSGDGLWINLYDCRIETLGVRGISVLSYDDANHTLGTIDKAIVIVSSYRATAGAQQNRLEYILTYLGISEENLINSESRIRDADMAKEMMELVKNNILTNAAQAMLAQANKISEMVFRLLK